MATNNRVGEFFGKMLNAVTIAHILHLQTHSFAEHMALNEFYDGLSDLADELIETYQGQYGIVTDYGNMTVQAGKDPIAFVKDLAKYIADTRYIISNETNIQNIIDEIVSLVRRTEYKLVNLT